MITQVGSQRDLLARLKYALIDDADGRPLAVLTGAGLSVPSVPGVAETIAILRKSLTLDDQRELDVELAKYKEPGEKYRQAFQFMGLRRPPSFEERVIRASTLRAFDHRGQSDEELMQILPSELEMLSDRWNLPAGQAALGRILTGLPLSMRGPVLTTNFDPLTEIAVARAGMDAVMHIASDDNSVIANLRVQTAPIVVHLHGFWRDSSALNTVDELLNDRPRLAASLRVILEKHTLLVLGYGGWSDVLTRTLFEIVAESRGADLDVLWCSFDGPDATLERINARSDTPGLAAIPSNAKFYANIDANVLLPLLEQELKDVLTYSETRRMYAAAASRLVGWAPVTAAQMAVLQPLATAESALGFLEGRIPTWADAVNPLVPTRELASEIRNRVVSNLAKRQSSLMVVSGPSGEGKSTLLMQVGALTAADDSVPSVRILEADHFGSARSILNLPVDRPHVLLVDEAHRHVDALRNVLEGLRKKPQLVIQIVIASGDTDWVASGGANTAWSQLVDCRQSSSAA